MEFKFLLILLAATLCNASAKSKKIVQPCKLDDYKCIGDNLAANSKCNNRVKGFVPPKYFVDTFHFDAPFFNSSYIDVNLIVKNQNKCFVTTFFVDTVTERAVLGIECPNLDLESDRTYIQHKTFHEDSYFYYHIRSIYPLIRITINFASDLDLCSASIFTDVVALPKLHVDPKNKPTANALTTDLSVLNIYERENFHIRGKALAIVFVESLLCNYRCPLPK